jgi:hypothetical protein
MGRREEGREIWWMDERALLLYDTGGGIINVALL